MRINVKTDFTKYVNLKYKSYLFLRETQLANFPKKTHNKTKQKTPPPPTSVLTCKLDNFQFPLVNSMCKRSEKTFNIYILTVIDSEIYCNVLYQLGH